MGESMNDSVDGERERETEREREGEKWKGRESEPAALLRTEEAERRSMCPTLCICVSQNSRVCN